MAARRAPSGGLPVARADLGEEASIQEGAAWNADRFETPRPLEAMTVGRLTPGASLRRVVRLDRLVVGLDLRAGGPAWTLTAYWRNLDDGRRLGTGLSLVTGLVASAPLRVAPAAWQGPGYSQFARRKRRRSGTSSVSPIARRMRSPSRWSLVR